MDFIIALVYFDVGFLLLIIVRLNYNSESNDLQILHILERC